MSAWVHTLIGLAALLLGMLLATLYASLRNMSRTALEELASERAGGAPGPRIVKIVGDPEGHAASVLLPRVLCQLTVVVSSVLWVESIAGGATQGWLPTAGGILIAGVLVWLLGTVIPISIAEHAAEGTIYRWAGFVRAMHVLMSPASAMTRAMDEVVRRMVGGKRLDASEVVEAEILEAVDEGEREGQIDEGEREMIEAVVEFRNRTVEQIMTPRTEVAAIEYSDDLAVVSRRMREIRHSRAPVFSGSLDTLDGMLYAKDLLNHIIEHEGKRAGGFSLRRLLRPAVFVPETKTVRELLAEMLGSRVHVAMVLDEYGGTSGLVTLEDIVEEVFGEIEDEYEKVAAPKAPSVDIDPEGMAAQVDGRLRIDEANDRLEVIGIHLPESEDYDTVGGLVVVTLGRIPSSGESVKVDGAALTVLEAEPTRVTRVRVERVVQSAAQEAVWEGGAE